MAIISRPKPRKCRAFSSKVNKLLFLLFFSIFSIYFAFGNPFLYTLNNTATSIEVRAALAGSNQTPFQLEQYSSLEYALANTDIILLYFAASWCSMSTPVTRQIGEIFSDSNDILSDPSKSEKKSSKSKLAIVYVSSDTNEKEALKYGSENWIRVPFESSDRTQLKRHFHTCAASEAKLLNVHRKHGIPNAIVIDSKTHDVISDRGMKDLTTHSTKVIEYWSGLLSDEKQELTPRRKII